MGKSIRGGAILGDNYNTPIAKKKLSVTHQKRKLKRSRDGKKFGEAPKISSAVLEIFLFTRYVRVAVCSIVGVGLPRIRAKVYHLVGTV